jgi:hypothetical protein
MKRAIQGEVWLGDLLTIFSELRPGEVEAVLIAQMLRLETTAASSRELVETAAKAPATPVNSPTQQPEPGAREEQPSEGEKVREARPSRLSPAASLVRVESGNPRDERPSWSATAQPMAPPPKSPLPAADPAPILAQRVRRAILTGAVSTLAPEGAPDVRALLRTIALGHPLVHLPRRKRPTLRHGAQVLIDQWLGMAPFAADAAGVAAHLRRLIPPDRLGLLRFVGSPLGRMRWPDGKRRAWSPPPRGTPIFVVSDFGLGGPLFDGARADLRQWLGFAKAAREAGCPVVGLIPREPARWPRELTESVTLLHWSERLTAGAVRRALAHGIRDSG